jgi:hypothetical protein
MTRRLLTASMLVVLLAGSAWAGTDAGEFCWTTNFADDMACALETFKGPISIVGAHCRWRGPTAYLMGGAGTVMPSYPTPGTYTLQLHLEHSSEFFAANHSCVLHGEINPSTLAGTWDMNCLGAVAPVVISGISINNPIPFHVNGTFTYDPQCIGFPLKESMQANGAGRLAGE